MLHHPPNLGPRDSVLWWGPGRGPAHWNPRSMSLSWWADRYGPGPHSDEDRERAIKEWEAEQAPVR